jgi:hypothetical protein
MSELKTRILAYSLEGITDIEIGADGNIYILVLYQGDITVRLQQAPNILNTILQ